jgi:SAM-dependent methyltransferase
VAPWHRGTVAPWHRGTIVCVFIDAAYWLLLGRAPDDDGRAFERRIESGQPRETVVRALISSPEFRFRYYSLTEGDATPQHLAPINGALDRLGPDDAFLSFCYECVLGRPADEGGINWHREQLKRGRLRSTTLWTMLTGEEFHARYLAMCPSGGQVPRDVQLCELANPAKWDNPDWVAVMKALKLPAEHKRAMHRKAYEFTQTVWGLRRLGALDDTTRILSVGAGHEALLYWLANAAGYVLATDLYQGAWQSKGALEGDIRVLAHPEEFAPFAYRRERLRFLQMNGTALGLKDGSFDVAYSLSSIEHFGGVAGARAAVVEMGRVVRSGGLVVVATEQLVRGPARDEVFTPEEIRRIVDVPGLSPVEPIDDGVWRRYEATPVDLVENPFETPHMLVRIEDTVFTSVFVFLRKA